MDETCRAKWILDEEDFSLSFADLANDITPTPESYSPSDLTFQFRSTESISDTPSIFEFSFSDSNVGQSSHKFPTYSFVYDNQLHLSQQTQITTREKFVALSKNSSSNRSSRSFSRSGCCNSTNNSFYTRSSSSNSSTCRSPPILSRRLPIHLVGPARIEARETLSIGGALRSVRGGGCGDETKEEKANREGNWVKKLVDSLALRCLRCHTVEPI